MSSIKIKIFILFIIKTIKIFIPVYYNKQYNPTKDAVRYYLRINSCYVNNMKIKSM